MALNRSDERQLAHSYLNRLPDAQLSAVRSLLEAMLDPVSRALANASIEDEEISEDDERAVTEAREWLKHNPGIPFEKVVTDLGFTMEEVKNYREPS